MILFPLVESQLYFLHSSQLYFFHCSDWHIMDKIERKGMGNIKEIILSTQQEYGTLQYRTLQYSTIQYSSIQYSTVSKVSLYLSLVLRLVMPGLSVLVGGWH